MDFETIRTWDDENRTAWCDKEAEQKAAEGGERVRKQKAEKERKEKKHGTLPPSSPSKLHT